LSKCLISLCEIYEQVPDYATEWYSLVCSQNEKNLFDSYFKCMLNIMDIKTNLNNDLIEMANGDENLANEIREDFIHLGIAIMAAFTYIPVNCAQKTQAQKLSVCKYVSAKLLDAKNMKFTETWLSFGMRHPTSCINVLKALYALCLSSSEMCLLLSKRSDELSALYDILSDKVRHILKFFHLTKCNL
jgi:hypothetical protein